MNTPLVMELMAGCICSSKSYKEEGIMIVSGLGREVLGRREGGREVLGRMDGLPFGNYRSSYSIS